jgi:hypothetical protein
VPSLIPSPFPSKPPSRESLSFFNAYFIAETLTLFLLYLFPLSL